MMACWRRLLQSNRDFASSTRKQQLHCLPVVLFVQLNLGVSAGGVLSQGYLGYQQVTPFLVICREVLSGALSEHRWGD